MASPRYRQVLFNLLSNAIKFTPQFGCVAVSVRDSAGEPDTVLVEVRDTGMGIAESARDHLFNVCPAFFADESLSPAPYAHLSLPVSSLGFFSDQR